MVLDAIVEDPDLVWLGAADEKAAHLLALTRIEQADLPHVTVGEGGTRTVRYFADRLPIGIHLAGRGVVVYVVTDPLLGEFRVFLERHAALLRALPAWTLRIVVPPQFPDIAQQSKQRRLEPAPDAAQNPDDRRVALVLRTAPVAPDTVTKRRP